MGQIKINELPQQSNTDNVKVVGVTESGNGVLVPIENSIATKEELAEIGSKVGEIPEGETVAEKLSEIDTKLNGRTLSKPTVLYNGSYTTAGAYIASQNHYCICDVSEFVGEKISTSNVTQYGFCGAWHHGENVTWVDGRHDGSPNQVTIPSGARYLYLYIYTDTDIPQISVTGEDSGFIEKTRIDIEKLQIPIEEAVKKTKDIEAELDGRSIEQATELKNGSLNVNGVWSSSSNKFCLVDVSNFVGSVINVSPTSKVIQWGFLQDFIEQVGGAFIGGRQTTSTNPPTNVVVPSGTKYIYLYLGIYTDIPSVQSPDEVEGIKEKVNAISSSPSMFFEKNASSMTVYIKTKGQDIYIAYPFKYAQSNFTPNLYPCFYDCWSIDKPFAAHLSNGRMISKIELFLGGVAELAIDTVCGTNNASQVPPFAGKFYECPLMGSEILSI